MNKKILLLGCGGQVGWELRRTLTGLGEVITVDVRDAECLIDLSDHAAVRALVREHKPELIVNAAAYTAVDKAEQDYDAAMAINGTAPGILMEEARRLDAVLVHYSTDYVFNGRHDKPYKEDDLPDPRSVYGETKLAGDRAVQEVGGRYLIFRTSWVYGMRGRNFLLTMRRLAAEREELSVVSDQIGAPTWSRFIAEATAQVLGQIYSPLHLRALEEISGVYNLTCAGACNWYEFAKAILDHVENPPKLIPITTEEYPAPAPRPPYSVLSHEKLIQSFGIYPPNWQSALRLCLDV